MDNNEIKTLLETQISYQRRIAKDLHSLYFLVIFNLVIAIVIGCSILGK